MSPSYIYILTNKRNGTLYIGVTNNLVRRVYEHKQGFIAGFSKRHELKNLVYYEVHHDIRQAITREKRLKKWKRDWKVKLIEQENEQWIDLYPGL